MAKDESSVDIFLEQLLEKYTEEEQREIQEYLNQWDKATYISTAQSILDHTTRKGVEPLKYLRKAHNFKKKGAVRIPKNGYRWDGSAVYRRNSEYLIIRPDEFGIEKIVSYGVNDE